jgi:hypothetical protein
VGLRQRDATLSGLKHYSDDRPRVAAKRGGNPGDMVRNAFGVQSLGPRRPWLVYDQLG